MKLRGNETQTKEKTKQSNTGRVGNGWIVKEERRMKDWERLIEKENKSDSETEREKWSMKVKNQEDGEGVGELAQEIIDRRTKRDEQEI